MIWGGCYKDLLGLMQSGRWERLQVGRSVRRLVFCSRKIRGLQKGSENSEDRGTLDYCEDLEIPVKYVLQKSLWKRETAQERSQQWASGFQCKLLLLTTCISSTSAVDIQFISDSFRKKFVIVARKKQNSPLRWLYKQIKSLCFKIHPSKVNLFTFGF